MEKPLDDEERELAAALGALSNATRLAILRRLREPRGIGDIEVGGQAAPRLLARQSVREHLDRLLEAGFVAAVPSTSDMRSPVHYVVNHQAIFALSEEVRGLARLRPAVETSNATVDGRVEARRRVEGPRLVVVKGLDEGAAFPLSPPPSPPEWVLGRKRGVGIPLDFDPFISAENSLIRLVDGVHVLEDLPHSRNGTTLNFEPLARRDGVPLAHGDVIGLGRTLLVYRDR